MSVFSQGRQVSDIEFQKKWNVNYDNDIPNVLLIGDSISIGYTNDVRTFLIGKANVMRYMNLDGEKPVNCRDTRFGLQNIDEWLGKIKWDIIHFNWGLHDLCYRDPDSNRDKVKGTISVSLEDYERNIEQLVIKLKDTGAKLIWANTTIVPDGEPGRFAGDEIKYNDTAVMVLKKHGVQINDLYSLTKEFPPSFFTAPGNVHFSKEGYTMLARQVAKKITETLEQR